MGTQRKCGFCGRDLKADRAFFTVSADSEGGPVGDFCNTRHYLSKVYDPNLVQAIYERAFVPVLLQAHADADALMPEEGILAR